MNNKDVKELWKKLMSCVQRLEEMGEITNFKIVHPTIMIDCNDDGTWMGFSMDEVMGDE